MKINNKYVEISMTRLNLSNRDIWFLNDNIDELFLLQELYLQGNNLLDIPIEIANLKQLKVLDISNNKIKELPVCLFEMKQLQELKVYGNPFSCDKAKCELQRRLPDTMVQ